jgi:hypothetical protein
MKSFPGQQPKLTSVMIEHLHARHIRAHQVNGSVKDLLVQGVNVAFLNKPAADFLQPPRGAQFYL